MLIFLHGWLKCYINVMFYIIFFTITKLSVAIQLVLIEFFWARYSRSVLTLGVHLPKGWLNMYPTC